MQKSEISSETDMINESFVNLLYDMIIQGNAETKEHIFYVQNYTKILAKYYSKLFPHSKMTKRKQELITQASRIHDVGKITIADGLLLKKGHMSISQFNLYKKHTIKGGQIIKSMPVGRDRDFERICYNVCLYHHEKYDGSGYPYGLKEDKIPIEAQIVGLADMYDALIHSGLSDINKSKACYMIMNGKCGSISPKLRECFEEAKDDIDAVDVI